MVITSVVLSGVATIISFGWWVTFFVGGFTMLLHQLLWCCRINKMGFILFALIALVETGLSFYVAVEMPRRTTPEGFCWPIFTIDLVCNEMRTFYSILHYVSGGMWLISAGLNLAFVASGRIAKYEEEENANDEPADAAAVDVEKDA